MAFLLLLLRPKPAEFRGRSPADRVRVLGRSERGVVKVADVGVVVVTVSAQQLSSPGNLRSDRARRQHDVVVSRGRGVEHDGWRVPPRQHVRVGETPVVAAHDELVVVPRADEITERDRVKALRALVLRVHDELLPARAVRGFHVRKKYEPVAGVPSTARQLHGQRVYLLARERGGVHRDVVHMRVEAAFKGAAGGGRDEVRAHERGSHAVAEGVRVEVEHAPAVLRRRATRHRARAVDEKRHARGERDRVPVESKRDVVPLTFLQLRHRRRLRGAQRLVRGRHRVEREDALRLQAHGDPRHVVRRRRVPAGSEGCLPRLEYRGLFPEPKRDRPRSNHRLAPEHGGLKRRRRGRHERHWVSAGAAGAADFVKARARAVQGVHLAVFKRLASRGVRARRLSRRLSVIVRDRTGGTSDVVRRHLRPGVVDEVIRVPALFFDRSQRADVCAFRARLRVRIEGRVRAPVAAERGGGRHVVYVVRPVFAEHQHAGFLFEPREVVAPVAAVRVGVEKVAATVGCGVRARVRASRLRVHFQDESERALRRRRRRLRVVLLRVRPPFARVRARGAGRGRLLALRGAVASVLEVQHEQTRRLHERRAVVVLAERGGRSHRDLRLRVFG
eukprot:30802-Pelagococcus_subviridis.AAC.26